MSEAPALAFAADDAALPRPYRLSRTWRETADTFSFEIDPVGDAGAVGGFAPGQFVMLYAFGVGEAPMSISGDPGRPGSLRHTTREVGPVTRALGRLRPGDPLGVRGPFGVGWPLAEARGRDLVVIAGGVGLAPLRPAIEAALADREAFRRLIVAYGARTPSDRLFREDLERWERSPEIEFEVTVDRGAGGWAGHVGVVTTLLGPMGIRGEESVAFVCGPEIMMRYAAEAMLGLGTPAERIFLSTERSMRCATGHCGHCQLGPFLVCRDGPVLSYARLEPWLGTPEV